MNLRTLASMLALLLACGGDDRSTDADTTTAATTTATTTADDPTGGEADGPTGQACTLRGMYVACESGAAEGKAFCDEFDGALVFGPCLPAPECELAGPLYCDKRCGLVAGIPTWIMEGSCGTSGEF